jgi:hypothetical protein
MKRILITTALTTLLGVCARPADVPTESEATSQSPLDHRFGIGLVLGEPTGASLKYWLSDNFAIDGAVGWSFRGENNLHVHADFLWHKFDLIPVPRGQMPLYFGAGARFKLQDNDDDRFGVRVPVGVSYLIEDIPVDVFLEVAPVVDVTPKTRFEFTAGVGVRYWF